MPKTARNRRKVKSIPPRASNAANQHERAKDYLSPGEMAKLLGMRRDELDLDRARLWVRRLKGGLSVEQP